MELCALAELQNGGGQNLQEKGNLRIPSYLTHSSKLSLTLVFIVMHCPHACQ